ncbi:MAG: hypothetical protein IT452_06620 [Planctomycetia bacterium]|nr:hypothetical protein [Planctomycetia bacterium]
MMQAYPPAPPPPRRSRFPFILAGCLVAFVTLCALVVIGAGAAAVAFVTVASSPPGVAPGHQTADLFFIHMAAGRWAEASRLVSPNLAGGVAAIGEDNRAVWGESRGCTSTHTNADVNFDEHGLRHTMRSTMQYSLKGTDGVVRKVTVRVQNGLVTDLSVEGKTLLGNTIYGPGACVIVPAPVPAKAPTAVAPPAETDEPEAVEPPKPAKKKSR